MSNENDLLFEETSDALEIVAPPDGVDVPYFQPVRWQAYLENGWPIPYASPREEYLRNEYEPRIADLLERWSGLNKEHEINLLFCDSGIRVEREKVQAIRLREMGFANPSNPEELAMEQRYFALRTKRIMRSTFERIENGYEKQYWATGSLLEGTYKKEEKIVEMTEATRNKAVDTLEKLSKLRAHFEGMASEIHKVIVQGGSNTTNIIQILMQNPETRPIVMAALEQSSDANAKQLEPN